MSLADLTAASINRTLDESDALGRDAFLERYGYGPAKRYYLVRDERRYDSKAIAGVAHGYARPDVGPLRNDDFSGGEEQVARRLRALGFEMHVLEGVGRNPPWSDEELILALDLYLRRGLLDDTDTDVKELSQVLNELPVHTVRPDAQRFRNPNGVALKLANFASLDPSYQGRGMSRRSKRDKLIWERFAGDENALAAAVAAVRDGTPANELSHPDEAPARPRTVNVEAQHVTTFVTSFTERTAEAERREQGLVLAYRDWLQRQGRRTGRREYLFQDNLRLVNDLVDETEGVLYEAKGDVRRESNRMALGQLFDYRRFESPPMRIGVLLPRQPTDDLVDLILSAGADAVWRTEEGFETRRASARSAPMAE